MKNPDSIIFDMDGTLWDGLDMYVESWNRGLKESNISKIVSRDEIAAMVGWESRKVLANLLPEYNTDRQQAVLEIVNTFPPVLLNEVGGVLYEGVRSGLEQLATKYKLFIVSNCAEGLIRIFMKWADIEHYITDEIAHGVNFMPKHYNIKTLIDTYNLKNPVYVGDTAGDSEQSALANVPFVFLSHGFGITEKYDLKFDDFKEFTAHFMAI
ncbi:MAG TPA: HAD family hydrolase [Sphingobacteriaceae bacterium]